MFARRPDGSGSGSNPEAPPIVPDVPYEDTITRFECVYCGAHAVGLLARATRGGWCSTCGSHELVPIEDVPADAKPVL